MANLSLLNCGDFTSAATLEHVSDIADGNGGGINFATDQDSGGQVTKIIDGIEYRVIGFWKTTASATRACVAISKNRGHWHTTVYDGNDGLADLSCTDNVDPHFTVIVGIDGDNYLHVWYDMHSNALKYRKSLHTIDDPAFGPLSSTLPMTGSNEVNCTYFRTITVNGYLYAMYRSGGANLGSIHFKKYDHATETWGAAEGTGTDGLLVNAISSGWSVYWGTIIELPNGTHCFTWHYRKATDGDLSDYENHCSVFWNQSTGVWTQSTGAAQTVPITPSNDDVFEAYTNDVTVYRPRLAVDASNRVHCVYWYLTKFVHRVWTSGSGWSDRHDVVTPSSLVSFADIVYRDSDDTIIVIYKDPSDNKIKKVESTSSDGSTWGSPATVHDTAITEDWSSATHDEYQWRENGTYFCKVPTATTVPFLRGVSGLFHFPLGEVSAGSTAVTRRPYNGSGLTDNNTTPSTASGKIGYAIAPAAANSEYLSIVDSPTWDFSTDVLIDCDVYLSSKGTDRGIVSKQNNTGNLRSYALLYQNAVDRFRFQASPDGSATTTVDADALGSPSTGQWYHICAWKDGTNNTLNIQVDGGTVNSVAFTGSMYNSTAPLEVGRYRTSSSFCWDGRIDQLTIAGISPTSAQRSFLYNSGNSRQWSEHAWVLPSIYSHGATATVNCNAGDTPSVTVSAWGDLPMSEALTGTDAASYSVVDNADGTWTITRGSAISAGNETLTLTLTNDAGSDVVDFTFSAAGDGDSQGDPLAAAQPSALAAAFASSNSPLSL